jgi:hypothetical protein
MNHKLSLALAISAVLWATTAHCALEIVEDAYEVEASRVLLPGSEFGQVIIRECTSCDATVLNVNGQTTYSVMPDAGPVSLDALRTAAEGTRDALICVFYRPESRTVTRIVLSFGH